MFSMTDWLNCNFFNQTHEFHLYIYLCFELWVWYHDLITVMRLFLRLEMIKTPIVHMYQAPPETTHVFIEHHNTHTHTCYIPASKHQATLCHESRCKPACAHLSELWVVFWCQLKQVVSKSRICAIIHASQLPKRKHDFEETCKYTKVRILPVSWRIDPPRFVQTCCASWNWLKQNERVIHAKKSLKIRKGTSFHLMVLTKNTICLILV